CWRGHPGLTSGGRGDVWPRSLLLLRRGLQRGLIPQVEARGGRARRADGGRDADGGLRREDTVVLGVEDRHEVAATDVVARREEPVELAVHRVARDVLDAVLDQLAQRLDREPVRPAADLPAV